MKTPLQLDESVFQEIAEEFVAPLFTGANVEVGPNDIPPRRYVQASTDFSRIEFRPCVEAGYSCVLVRDHPFTSSDVDVIKAFIMGLKRLRSVWNKSFLPEMLRASMRGVVAQAVTDPETPKEFKDTIADILMHFEAWSEQTYEGRRISSVIGVEPSSTASERIAVQSVMKRDFGAVLSVGPDAFVTVGANGMLKSFSIPSSNLASTTSFAPLKFSRIAEWTGTKRVGIGLNRNGEIFVFKRKALVFCRRRGKWHHFTHEAVIQRMSLGGAILPDVCSAIYESALDVSFTRSGGCLAVVSEDHYDGFMKAERVAAKDLLKTGKGVKTECLRHLVHAPFQDIDRRLRANILAIDGSTIIDHKGNVLAIGAIVEVAPGSPSGGRLAAAKSLAAFGLGVKISSDGPIRVFSQPELERVREIASVG